MLVRYRMNSGCTLANMQADIHKIILGTATFDGSGVPTNLSAGCDTAASIKYGTYPSAKYASVGTGATASGSASSIAATVLTVGGSVTGTFVICSHRNHHRSTGHRHRRCWNLCGQCQPHCGIYSYHRLDSQQHLQQNTQ